MEKKCVTQFKLWNRFTLFRVISSLYLHTYTHTHDLNFVCLHCLSLRWIMGRSATRVVKGCSSQCRVAAAQSLYLCHAAAQLPCMPSTQESWSLCSGVTTTMSTAASSTQTTRWDTPKSQVVTVPCIWPINPSIYLCFLCQSVLVGLLYALRM